jgi:hypothetical protein
MHIFNWYKKIKFYLWVKKNKKRFKKRKFTY